MEPSRVPAALRDKLGDEGTFGLLELLQAAGRGWSEQVLSIAVERFERRLTEEISALRVEIAHGNASLRQEVRQEVHDSLSALRKEMYEGFAALRQEIANVRVELLRWSFLFWIGQVATMAGLLAFMLRATGR